MGFEQARVLGAEATLLFSLTAVVLVVLVVVVFAFFFSFFRTSPGWVASCPAAGGWLGKEAGVGGWRLEYVPCIGPQSSFAVGRDQ